jgi:hypothetical protein
VFQILIKILFAVLVVRLLGSVFGLFRGNTPRKRPSRPSGDPTPKEKPKYKDLTPYEIEDAEFEDIPKEEN